MSYIFASLRVLSILLLLQIVLYLKFAAELRTASYQGR
jgi:hypothetical protein